jgi:hypothetical protein
VAAGNVFRATLSSGYKVSGTISWGMAGGQAKGVSAGASYDAP